MTRIQYESMSAPIHKVCHLKHSFPLAGPREQKSLFLKFGLAPLRSTETVNQEDFEKRDGLNTFLFRNHASEYHQLNQRVPENLNTGLYRIENCLHLYLNHEGVLFSKDKEKDLYFQMV